MTTRREGDVRRGTPRVLHVITGLRGGGAETLLHGLVVHESTAEHAVVSMCDEGDFGARIRAAGVPVHALGMGPGRPTLGGALALSRIIGHWRPTVAHAWMYHASLLATVVAPPHHVPLLWGLHAAALDHSHYRRMTYWTTRACAALSRVPTAIVANSDYTRDDHVRQGFRARRWEVIPNGFDLTRFRPDAAARCSVRAELGVSDDAPLVGLIARWDPMKDQPTFLRSARLVAHRYPNAHFVLAGVDVTWENAPLAALVRELGLAERVHLLGYRTDVPRLTAALDVATSASLFGESFSNTIAEAMACEVPCVVTRVTVLPTLVGDTGVVVPPREPEALAAAVSRLLAVDAMSRRMLGAAARARVVDRFTVNRMAASYEALYREVGRRDR